MSFRIYKWFLIVIRIFVNIIQSVKPEETIPVIVPVETRVTGGCIYASGWGTNELLNFEEKVDLLMCACGCQESNEP